MRFSCFSAARVTASLLLSCLVIAPGTASTNPSDLASPEIPAIPPTIPISDSDRLTGEHTFALRHVFHRGTYRNPSLHKRLDVPFDASVYIARDDDAEKNEFTAENDDFKRLPSLRARSSPVTIERLADRRKETIEDYLAEARWTGRATTLSPSAWTTDEIAGPDITDRDTILSLAVMSANAYVLERGTGDWQDVDHGFNHSQGFGWEGDGLRGHIFATPNNETIVISLKGTSTAVFDGAETTTNDKVNDNLFFSCCCGAGGQYLWRQVCDCYSTTFTCNSTCLVGALRDENRYYRAAIDLYTNVTEIYPDSNVWITGHSLGGAVSSLLGQTFGLPTVTFEAPGDALPANRLGLPTPPGSVVGMHQTKKNTGVVHFGHTADPVYMGTCNGATSTCTLAGYAMESQCHAGLSCVYDTVGDKGWRVGIGSHRIWTVIHEVLEAYDEVPKCEADTECVDCFNWKYFESNGSDSTTTTTTTTSSAIRTQTCKTPGWWGCLDETTTTTGTMTSSSTTSATTTATTTTCHTPGWFGCKDPTSTTTPLTPAPTTPSQTTTPTQTQSSTCSTPGWFGCNDPSSTGTGTITPAPTVNPSATLTHTPTGTAKCTSKEWFGLICVDPSPASDTASVSTTSSPIPTSKPGPHVPLPHFKKGKCLERNWLGICKVREGEGVVVEEFKIEI